MDDNDGPKNGDTGQIGPKPSTDSLARQTPTQPGVPAWLFARNNSVHAPVFRQPSERKSTSVKPSSMSSLAFGSKGSQSPWAEIRAAIKANNTKDEMKASPPPPKPSPSAKLDTLNDDQALALLLKNETVAGLLQKEFKTRVEEHQQKLVRAFNQRLFELEEYTRNWRDTTKELWSAVSEGTFNPNGAQRETLGWKGPQEAGRDFNPESPKASQEIVEKELGSEGTVIRPSAKDSNASHSASPFNLLNWINSSGCGSKDFKKFGYKIAPFDKKYPPRIVFRHKNKFGKVTYRSITSIESATNNMTCGDVILELTPSNVSLLGKAFCYLKNTKDRILPQVNVADVSTDELDLLYDGFSQGPTKRNIDVLSLYKGKEKSISDFFAANINVSVVPKRLLIARPCYTTNDDISGARFFDVGSGTYTTRQKKGKDIVLFEDMVAFTRLARLLFCINKGIVHVPLSTTSPGPSHSEVPTKVGYKSAGAPGQAPCQPSPSAVPDITQEDELWDCITEIKGSPTNFVTQSAKKHFMTMRSPHLPSQNFSELLGTFPNDGASDDSRNSDLIMLEQKPENVTFRCPGKRPLPAAGQEAKVAKKPRLTAEPSKQLPQNDPHSQAPEDLPNLPLGPSTPADGFDKEHLGKPPAGSRRSQDDTEHKEPHTTSTAFQAQPLPLGEERSVAALNPPLPPSQVIATNIHQLREQLRQLGCRFADNFDQIDEGTIGGTIEQIEQLRTDLERVEAMSKTQCRFDDSQNIDEQLRPGARLPSLGVSDQTNDFLEDSDSVSIKAECATETHRILRDQNESTPVERQKPFSSINENSSLLAPAMPGKSSYPIPTEQKAFFGVPKEPRATRTAAPQQHKTRWQYLDNHRAVSVGPNSHHHSLQAIPSLDDAPRSSLATPDKVDAVNGLTHSDGTAFRNHREPLRAVVSPLHPSHDDGLAEPADPNLFYSRPTHGTDRTVGTWNQSVPEFTRVGGQQC